MHNCNRSSPSFIIISSGKRQQREFSCSCNEPRAGFTSSCPSGEMVAHDLHLFSICAVAKRRRRGGEMAGQSKHQIRVSDLIRDEKSFAAAAKKKKNKLHRRLSTPNCCLQSCAIVGKKVEAKTGEKGGERKFFSVSCCVLDVCCWRAQRTNHKLLKSRTVTERWEWNMERDKSLKQVTQARA